MARCTYLEIRSVDARHVDVVRGRTQIFVLLRGEDVNSDEMHLGVAVFARLRGGHLHDLARPTLDHDESVLAQG